MVSAAEVEFDWDRIVGHYKERISRIPADAPPRLARLMTPAEIMVAMDDIVREALDELVAYRG
jgi:hypothetical protein